MSNKDNEDMPLTEIEDENRPVYYIAIGASAGGLEAIEQFITNTPDDTDLAYIIIQHLSPDYKSLMVELLAKFTNMPVQRAENYMKVKKNSIYLIPPKKNLTIFHGELLLSDQDRSSGINLPIDIFFLSLAEDQQSRAIGIILSGTGSDGTRGVRSIKEEGGMVMVQDEHSAKFDGMPRSAIATGLADYILPADEMPQQLLKFIKHPYAAQQKKSSLLSDEDGLSRIFFLLREKCKVDFTFYKSSTVFRRLERRMSVNQIDNLKDYVRYLEKVPHEVSNLYRELLIGVTRFFRDVEIFDEIETKWLPELIQSCQGNSIRFWIVGCSTGEEAYSLAIISNEILESLDRSLDIKIFATDVDQNAIHKASTGVYTESIVADISPRLISKYFQHSEDSFQIIRKIREMVVFAQHDILKDPPFTNIDFVSCRNVLIYFQSVLQKRALEMFNFALNSNGILLLGNSETTGDLYNVFEPLNNKLKIYRSFGKLKSKLDNDQMIKFNPRSTQLKQIVHSSRRPFSGSYAITDDKILERFINAITPAYIPMALLVNEEMEILHIFGDTSGYFLIPSGKMENNLVKMARKEFTIPLATGINKVLKNGSEQRYSNIPVKINEEKKLVNINMVLLDSKRNQQPLVAVFFETPTTNREKQSKIVEDYDIGKETEQRILDLEQELQFTKESLQATVEELETSNEELQATNEELLASNEELQSTNEELQSVNEELYTVNSEHQSKIVELMELNNDLDNLLVSTDIATLFLDEDLELRKFTTEIKQLFKVLENDLGRPISHIPNNLKEVDILALIMQVKADNHKVELEVQTQDDFWYLMRILPYHIAPNIFSGVVLTFININNLKLVKSELSITVNRFRKAQKLAVFGIWDWNIKTNKIYWSEGVEPLFGLEKGSFFNTFEHYQSFLHPEDVKKVDAAIQKSLKERTPYEIEHRIIWPDETIHWLHASGQIEYDESDEPQRMVGFVRDISKLKAAQINLRHFEDILKYTLDNLHMIAVQIDLDGKITYANEFLCQMSGWQHDELIGKDWFVTFIPQENRKEIFQAFVNILDGKSEIKPYYKNPIMCKNGVYKTIWWNNTRIINQDGKVIGVSSIGEDISKPGFPISIDDSKLKS